MKSAVRASLGALEIAGSLCGVPFVGAAALVLKDIIAACDEVRIKKVASVFRWIYRWQSLSAGSHD